MNMNTRKEIVETLRQAADGTIPEQLFWEKFKSWRRSESDPRFMTAWYHADEYWGNFHARNIFLIPVKPNKYQLKQGQDILRILAQAFEEDWHQDRIEKALNDI
jgi:hypothetical protein